MPVRTAVLLLSRLHFFWWLAVGISGLLVIAGAWGINLATHKPERALQWAMGTGLVLGVELLILRRNLHKNRSSPDAPLRGSLGWGNVVTLGRGAAYGLMAGFLFAPRPGGLLDWTPALLYTGAIVADYWDGYLARITHHTTMLGEILDIEFDGLGMFVAMGLAVQYGQLPEIILLLAAGRPLFLWGMKWRERSGRPNYPMTPSDERRIAAGLLMGFMGIVLWPVFAPPATHIAGAIFGGAVAASFVRDWLVVIGWLRPASPGYIRWRGRLKAWLFGWLPLLLRLACLPAAGWFLWSAGSNSQRPAFFTLLAGLALLAAVAALTGTAARLAGIVLAGVACAGLIGWGDSLPVLTLLAVAAALVVLGNGRLALWTPDETFLRRRAGSTEPVPAEPVPAEPVPAGRGQEDAG
ncbi:MAG: CDP-alcohol phosphatidyltransferase family protein [Caldilineaceae bacterium]|nr:CDP-alcohol phosphatidyltransferase family protein [Caldilineaceae bacterium]